VKGCGVRNVEATKSIKATERKTKSACSGSEKGKKKREKTHAAREQKESTPQTRGFSTSKDFRESKGRFWSGGESPKVRSRN